MFFLGPPCLDSCFSVLPFCAPAFCDDLLVSLVGRFCTSKLYVVLFSLTDILLSHTCFHPGSFFPPIHFLWLRPPTVSANDCSWSVMAFLLSGPWPCAIVHRSCFFLDFFKTCDLLSMFSFANPPRDTPLYAVFIFLLSGFFKLISFYLSSSASHFCPSSHDNTTPLSPPIG